MWLQWVHGQITVVMWPCGNPIVPRSAASMGPRSDNRGYGRKIPGQATFSRASMGPRSDNRGYGTSTFSIDGVLEKLQWVHGQITVVMHSREPRRVWREGASMGPRSDNRGYEKRRRP